MKSLLLRLLLGAAGLFAVSLAQAQAPDYPTRPIRFILSQGAGGTTDAVARTIALKLGERFGTQVVVENRAGANGIIGAEAVARAAPDGYTITLGSSSTNAINPSLYKQLPYDALRDFTPISLVGKAYYVVVVHPSVPANSLKALIALAKAKPGRLNYGSGGSSARIGSEMFNLAAGMQLNHIPYKTSPQALNDLMAGQLDVMIEPVLSAAPHIKSGKLRALAVTTPKRLAQLPEVPTTAEAGLPAYDFSAWLALYAPAGVPSAIVQKLNAEVVRILALPEVIERFNSVGFESQASTPQQLAEFTQSELAAYVKVVKDAGIPKE
jgi:tripartite-type tricarboxylate transporter receptor subunit TctC